MAKFVIKKVQAGYTFHLVAGNGETIGTSEAYTTEANCRNGIASVKNNAGSAEIEDQTLNETKKNPKFEIYKDMASKFRFRLKASNGEKILASEGYSSKDACKNGISSVKLNASNASIEIGY
ncbi:hypothetical protein EDD76_102285 [Kineothrix alysoides]|uniref:DUF1508 domain-containing protein n=1 Tax=Kineothrix alysoides TaxID=1469948 RepID=A0A4V2QCK5_9FIRM|nr:YegP family protein [Kineothrix alysoides]TCL60587.1 hypothetical protein EDD76_102285 [Kineothrix alysoides]